MRLNLLEDINRDYSGVMNYATVDRFLVKILWWHVGFVVLMAFTNSYLRLSEHFRSPFSWRVLSGGEALAATLVGIGAAAIPTLVRGRLVNHFAWRVIVSVALTVYSYLFVFMSGGSIEMHFHFFMVMALLVVYSDWRLGWVVLVLTAAHHGILNYVAPHWVYFYGRNDLSVIAHALPVTATAIFTSLLCDNNRRSVAMLEQRTIEMRAAKEDAVRANKAKSEFLSRMSHELRTPMNAILGFAQLLEMDSLSPSRRESVGHILKGGYHLLDLINDVLDIGRIEAGRLDISVEPVSVKEVVEASLELIAPLAAEENVRLKRGTSGGSELFVRADRQRLKQILLNLLSNAVKYNRKGGLVTVSEEEVPGGRLRVKVSDTGRGIAPDKLDRLFIPFDRLGAEQTAIEGTGLGLALSRHLIEMMGGTLGVDSAEGRGSTFWIELPPAHSPLGRSERTDVAKADRARPASQRAGVLLIEGNLSNLEVVQGLLAHRPEVTLVPAMQGRMGLDLARKHRPRLILLDLRLPDISGDEMLRRLKEDPETCDIPVVVFSADAPHHQVAPLLAAGAQAYFPEPIDVKKLLVLIEEALGNRLPSHSRRSA